MRRIIKHSKRFKDYHVNTPKKLFDVMKRFDFSVSKTAAFLGVNSGHISALINDGYEPRNPDIRKKLFLKTYSICPACKRKLMYRTKQKEAKEEIPDYLKMWKHLSKQERQTVIQQYITYKKKKEG